jgi:hypothetical protein
VLGLVENVLDTLKVPSSKGHFAFNFHLGLLELVGPCFKYTDTLLNGSDGLLWVLFEDDLDLDV